MSRWYLRIYTRQVREPLLVSGPCHTTKVGWGRPDSPQRQDSIVKRSYRGMSILLLAATVLLPGCNDTGLEFQPAGSSIVELGFDGLSTLDGGLNYHAWVIRFSNGSYWGAPLGIFNIDDSGNLTDPATGGLLSGEFEAGLYPAEVYGVQISIELSDTLLTQPSGTFLLGGPVEGRTGNLSVAHWLGMAVNFEPMEGLFLLMTPSDEDPTNERSGLWFADNTTGEMLPGLFLPEAPEGWDYEGWVVAGTDTLSTGKFVNANVRDTTDLHGGLSGSPAVPGQDFLYDPPQGVSFPLDLAGGQVFVTMEPWEEWDVAPERPFPFRLMSAQIPQDAEDRIPYVLESLFGEFPRGVVTVRDPEEGTG